MNVNQGPFFLSGNRAQSLVFGYHLYRVNLSFPCFVLACCYCQCQVWMPKAQNLVQGQCVHYVNSEFATYSCVEQLMRMNMLIQAVVKLLPIRRLQHILHCLLLILPCCVISISFLICLAATFSFVFQKIEEAWPKLKCLPLA